MKHVVDFLETNLPPFLPCMMTHSRQRPEYSKEIESEEKRNSLFSGFLICTQAYFLPDARYEKYLVYQLQLDLTKIDGDSFGAVKSNGTLKTFVAVLTLVSFGKRGTFCTSSGEREGFGSVA